MPTAVVVSQRIGSVMVIMIAEICLMKETAVIVSNICVCVATASPH